MMRKNKKWLKIFLVLILVMSAFGAKYLFDVARYKQRVAQIAFTNVDVSKVYDGEYIGECDVKFISAKVLVRVNNGKIENIKILEHKNDKGSRAEKIVQEVINKNSTDVELVSGATNSSKVILKAIENALD